MSFVSNVYSQISDLFFGNWNKSHRKSRILRWNWEICLFLLRTAFIRETMFVNLGKTNKRVLNSNSERKSWDLDHTLIRKVRILSKNAIKKRISLKTPSSVTTVMWLCCCCVCVSQMRDRCTYGMFATVVVVLTSSQTMVAWRQRQSLPHLMDVSWRAGKNHSSLCAPVVITWPSLNLTISKPDHLFYLFKVSVRRSQHLLSGGVSKFSQSQTSEGC